MLHITEVLVIILIFVNCITAAPDYSIDLEENLRSELFTNYSVLQRPAQKVRAAISLTILTINDLNIKDQTLSLSGYLTLDWEDSRLAWSNTSATTQDYTSVNFLFSNEEYVWRPAIIIENAVDGISVISDEAIPMRITQHGRVVWNPAGVYKVSCESDTKYYPMDTQTCYLKVSGWAYTEAELELEFKLSPVDISFYSPNGEWDLVIASGSGSETRSRDGTSFSSVSFLIKLQRRLLFHVINTLFPVAMMALLIAFVFKLPVESGEKIGFSLTVLLSYAVYLTLISDNIPSTSVTVCFLSLYLAFILLMATIAVGCTTFVISLHIRTDDDRISDRVKNLTFKYLVRIACWKSGGCGRNKVNDETNSVDANELKKVGDYIKQTSHEDLKEPTGKHSSSHDLTWKELSEIMDKVFYNVYMFLIILSTVVLFLIIIIGYSNA